MKAKILTSFILLIIIILAIGGSGLARETLFQDRFTIVDDRTDSSSNLGAEAQSQKLISLPPRNIDLVAQIGGTYRTVAVQGNYAYLGVGPSFIIMDISNPLYPVRVGQTILPNSILEMAVSGNYVYIADGGLRIIDVSNPSAPSEIGFYALKWPMFTNVKIAGNYAYILTDDSLSELMWGYLRIIDISQPQFPYEAGKLYLSGDLFDVAISGNYAYVSIAFSKFSGGGAIIDINVPSTPGIAGYFYTFDLFDEIEVSGNFLFGVDNDGIHIFIVSDPRNTFEVGAYEIPSLIPVSMVRSGNYIYIAGLHAFYIIDITTPTNHLEAGHCSCVLGDLAIEAGYVYSISDDLHIVDVGNPSDVKEVGLYKLGMRGYAYKVDVTENYAYIASGQSGLRIIDVHVPNSPMEIGFYVTNGSVLDVDVKGNYAYVATTDYGSLRILDVNVPGNPIEIGSWFTTRYTIPMSVNVEGNHAYVTLPDSLYIIDVSDPTTPVLVGSFNGLVDPQDIVIKGGFAYIADGSSGLVIIDISVPGNPQKVGFYDTPYYAAGIALSGAYAYITDGSSGLRIIDVSDGGSPFEVGFFISSGYAGAVAVENNSAYVAFSTGLHVINVSSLSLPTEIGYYPIDGSGVSVSDNIIYVAADHLGLFLFRYLPELEVYLPVVQQYR